jgi:hypothetical protein
MRLLISSYFEKESVVHLTVLEYSVIQQFFVEALSITTNGLNTIEEAKKDETWRQELITQLVDELLWHAKSFALRLMADTAFEDKDKSEESRRKLGFLAHDKKFVKLIKDTMHEILSYYRGGKLLEIDKTLHP